MKNILFISLLFCSLSWSQTYLNIKNKDGTVQTYSLEEIRKLTFDIDVSVEDANKIANAIKSFSLMQNYPNPFNPSTTIEYKIPEAGNVEVKIYDITGQLVRTIVNSFENAGKYKVKWNSKNDFGKNVSSGVYFCKVKFENTFLTKKLMLLK